MNRQGRPHAVVSEKKSDPFNLVAELCVLPKDILLEN